MYNCPEDDTKLELTGEEGPKAWFKCPKCGKRFEVDLRDDSIEEYKKSLEGENFKFTIKMIPTLFIAIGGEEVNANDVFSVIEDMYGEDAINDYNLHTHAADLLVKEGILKKIPGERMATLYAPTDKFNKFYDDFTNDYYESSEKIQNEE